MGVIVFIMTRDTDHANKWGASLGPKKNGELDQQPGGGGKKLMNLNIVLIIFIGYLLFYLYELVK